MREEDEAPPKIEKILCPLKNLISAVSWEKGLSFRPSPSGILLTTGLKTGTTWVEQILHGLRSRGDMTFEEITVAIPSLEYGHDSGVPDLYAEQSHRPRMFQSHLEYQNTPKGFGKYIVVVRDPKDSAVSLYYYRCNWFFEEEELSLDDFVEWSIVNDFGPDFVHMHPTQMHHMMSWYPHFKDENVLWIHYEDLKADVKSCIRLIAEFIGIGVGHQKLLDLVEKQASFEFMKKYKEKFDDHTYKLCRNEVWGLSKEAGLKDNPGKVRNGSTNEGRKLLSPRVLAKLDEKWTALMQPVTGFSCYKYMRDAVNKELGRSFSENSDS